MRIKITQNRHHHPIVWQIDSLLTISSQNDVLRLDFSQFIAVAKELEDTYVHVT